MYDSWKVIIGIIVFLLAFTSPVWTNFFSTEIEAPDLVYPEKYDECVEETEYMKSYHMDMLNDWRDLVVREDIRYYTKDGEAFMIGDEKAEMSLTKTCLNCHDSKADFCDECHDYMDVTPYCWDCHIDEYNPEEKETPRPETGMKTDEKEQTQVTETTEEKNNEN